MLWPSRQRRTQMRKRTKAFIAAGAIAAAGVGGAIAVQAGGDSERPIYGDALAKAKAAALEHVGEGRVTDTEEGDEESYYEVEVTKEDGTQVDVQLDEDFNVVGSESDNDESEDQEDEAEERDSR